MWLATAACAADLPLARIDAGPAAPRELTELLAKVVQSMEPSENADATEDERMLRRLRLDALEVLATEGDSPRKSRRNWMPRSRRAMCCE